MAEKKSKMLTLWMVSHPDHCTVPVTADTREQATVKAAALWGVPWARVAADCDVEKRYEILPHNCPKCGNYVYDPEEEYCTRCRVALRQDEERLQRRKAGYYREQAIQEKRIATAPTWPRNDRGEETA